MIFELSKEFDLKCFDDYVKTLKEKGAKVELKQKRSKRTYKQNRYLHLLLQMVAMHVGVTLEEAKERYYKYHSNADIFVYKEIDKLTGEEYIRLRSSASLNTKEMYDSIENLKGLCKKHFDLELPEANDKEYLEYIEMQWEREKHYTKIYEVKDL